MDQKKIPQLFLYLISAFVFLGVLAFVSWHQGVFYNFGFLPCYPPPSIQVDGVAIADVLVWLDIDSDGEKGPNEPGIPGAKVRLLYEVELTNDEGLATISLFRPGCACDCNLGESISVDTPPDMYATTPTKYELDETDKLYKFGFAPIDA
jgi:hypothetical protein